MGRGRAGWRWLGWAAMCMGLWACGCPKPTCDVGAEEVGTPTDLVVDDGGDVTTEHDLEVGPEADVAEDVEDVEDVEVSPERAVVLVTLNTHAFQEGADSLLKLAQIGVELARLEADIVALNEVMSGRFWAYGMGGVEHDAGAIIKEVAEQASGDAWELVSFPWAQWADGEVMANVLLVRRGHFEATDVRPLPTTDFWPAPQSQRVVGYARVRLPGLAPVHAFVTHAWGWDSVDTAPQIAEVKAFMAEKAQGDAVLEVVMGDFNVPSTAPHYQTWLAPPYALEDAWTVANPATPHVSTQHDGQHRIDYIMLRPGGCVVDGAHFAFDGQMLDGQVSPVVSDHKGVVVHLRCPR